FAHRAHLLHGLEQRLRRAATPRERAAARLDLNGDDPACLTVEHELDEVRASCYAFAETEPATSTFRIKAYDEVMGVLAALAQMRDHGRKAETAVNTLAGQPALPLVEPT